MPDATHGIEWLARPFAFLDQCRSRFGEAFTLDLGAAGRYVVVSHPDAVRDVFTGDAEVFHAGKGNAVLRPFLGAGSLLLLEGERHLRERKLLLPAFGRGRVESLGRKIHDVAGECLDEWGEGDIDARHLQDLSLRIGEKAVFGDAPDDDGLRDALRDLLNDPKFNLALVGRLGTGFTATPSWRAFEARLERVRAVVRGRIDAATAAHGDGVLAVLIGATDDQGRILSREHLRDEALTLVVTSYETTATALAWALFWIATTPRVLARLRGELGGTSSLGAAVGSAYLDATCREALRIRPILPVVARELQRDAVVGGWSLEAGTVVAPCAYLAHRREEAFAGADDFRPERFLERSFSAYEYFPFGGGARRCLGMTLATYEMRVVLGALLGRFTPRVDAPESVAPERRSVTIAPGRLRVRLVREPPEEAP